MPTTTISIPTIAQITTKLGNYLTKEKPNRDSWFATNAAFFAGANDQSKANMLISLSNDHFWYLRFHPTELKNAVKKLLKDKPWIKAQNVGFVDFEDLRSHIENLLKGPQIQNMVIYDVSLYIAYFVNSALLPSKNVYIHGKPHRHAKVVLPVIISGIKINGKDYFVDRSLFPAMFNALTTDEIEDFLCKFDRL